MKKIFFAILVMNFMPFTSINAVIINDDFEANSFAWTECAYESNKGTAIISNGVLTITSKGVNKGMSALLTGLSGVKTQVGENTFFETHCYAPISLKEDFTITSNVLIDKLGDDRIVGFVFNYRDAGNFYCFTFNDEMVSFIRYVDNEVVGSISQGVKWKKKGKLEQKWTLIKQGDEIAFLVDDMEIIRVRYMPLEYDGVGFYTYGKQKLIINDMTYQQ